MSSNEGFLSRWSRRKHGSRNPEGDATPSTLRDETGRQGDERRGTGSERTGPDETRFEETKGAASAPRAVAPQSRSADAVPVTPSSPDLRESPPAGQAEDDRSIELPSIASLTPQSDFRPFMQAGVDAATRNAALAQLFRDPHFNVMDGLDVYIDDYNKTEPIPPAMLARLRQLHSIGLTDDEIEGRTADAAESGESLARTDAVQTLAQAGDVDVGEGGPTTPTDIAQAAPAPASTRREDAAAEPNIEETDGEDEGSRM